MSEAEPVTKAVVQAVVAAACGEGARITGWTLRPVTQSFCKLRSLQVEFQQHGKDRQDAFIVKQALGNSSDPFAPYRTRAFEKEAFFYQTLAPLLSKQLLQPLKVAKCYYADCTTPENELIVLEDLRTAGYRTSTKWLLDDHHVRLVLGEAARLHGASLLLQEDQLALRDRFPLLNESFMMDEKYRSPFQGVVNAATLHLAASFCDGPHLQGFKSWLERVAPHALRFILPHIVPNAPFAAICHGDIHGRNTLFKYDETGVPIDVMFVDLQVTRVTSVAADISYLTHFSILSSERPKVLPSLLDHYYSSLSLVMQQQQVAPKPVPFTREQLTQEIGTNKAGLLLATLMLPIATQVGNASECWDKTGQDEEGSSGGETAVVTADAGIASHELKVNEIVAVVRELAEEGDKLGLHREYANVEDSLWNP